MARAGDNSDGGIPSSLFGVDLPTSSGAPGSPGAALLKPQIPVNNSETVQVTDTASGASQDRYSVHQDSTSTDSTSDAPTVEPISGVHLTGSGAGLGNPNPYRHEGPAGNA